MKYSGQNFAQQMIHEFNDSFMRVKFVCAFVKTWIFLKAIKPCKWLLRKMINICLLRSTKIKSSISEREKEYTHRRTNRGIMFQVLHFYFENEIAMWIFSQLKRRTKCINRSMKTIICVINCLWQKRMDDFWCYDACHDLLKYLLHGLYITIFQPTYSL